MDGGAADARRAAWRIIASVKQKEGTKAYGQQADDAKEYIFALEGELQRTCAGILTLTDEDPSTREPKVFYDKTETIEQQASKLDGSCAAQAPEWEKLQRLRAEGLVAARDTNKLLNDCELIPKWFNLVKGVIDSEGLPLNVYRETLLQNRILRAIKRNHVMEYLEMLAEIAELKDAYRKFYEQLVKCMKLGTGENSVDGVEIAEVLRFNTSKSGDEEISLKEYVDRMKEGQNDICYIISESIIVVSSSSFLENLRKTGHEVLHMTDSVDEYAVHQPKEFDGMKPKSTMKEELDLGDQDEKEMLGELNIESKPLKKFMKETLGDKIEEAIVNDRSFDSLRAHTMSEHGLPANTKRITQQPSGSQQQRQSTRKEREREKERESVRKGKRGKEEGREAEEGE